MEIVLVTITFIDIVLAIMIIVTSVSLTKRQDRLRHYHYVFRKRLRLLRHFKALYHSYSLYRSAFGLGVDNFLKDEQLYQLARNEYLGEDVSCLATLDKHGAYQIFREKLHQLDLLSEDLEVLYSEGEAKLMQDFIFWYRILLSEIGNRKRQASKENELDPIHRRSMEAEVKNLERCYQELQESRLLGDLEAKVKLKC